MLTRRRLLFGGGAIALAGAAAAVVQPDSEAPNQVPSGPVGEIVSGSFFSKARGATTGWSVAHPEGSAAGTPLPLLLELHGRGDDHRVAFGSHRLQGFLSAAVRSGVPPFAIASVDGGDDDYWHARASGADAQNMVVSELLPLLASRGLRTERLALGGWSMGGYGALLLAERLGPSRVAAVAVDSPALWTRWEDSSQGSFDGPEDFAAHDVLANTGALEGIHLRVTCGTSDPFSAGVRTLMERLPAAQYDLGPGGHDLAWWRHAAPAQLDYAGRHLA